MMGGCDGEGTWRRRCFGWTAETDSLRNIFRWFLASCCTALKSCCRPLRCQQSLNDRWRWSVWRLGLYLLQGRDVVVAISSFGHSGVRKMSNISQNCVVMCLRYVQNFIDDWKWKYGKISHHHLAKLWAKVYWQLFLVTVTNKPVYHVTPLQLRFWTFLHPHPSNMAHSVLIPDTWPTVSPCPHLSHMAHNVPISPPVIALCSHFVRLHSAYSDFDRHSHKGWLPQ